MIELFSTVTLSDLTDLSPDELARYRRHLTLPVVGVDGQLALKRGSVLAIGAGGLGSPLLLYLAAAGVGTLGIVDDDVVDTSNLQRQVIHAGDAVGRPKTRSAAERIAGLNPNVRVVEHRQRLSSANALEIAAAYDVIVDGSDNFPTRYLVNDACVLLGKPLVYGSVFRLEGQASVFDARSGPCYRCLYPEPPPPGAVPSCEEGGVLGIVPGIIGLIQATEAIKLLLGRGRTLLGRLLIFDALEMRFAELRARKDPNCPVCGELPTVTELIDYEAWCGAAPREADMTGNDFDIEPAELKAKLDAGQDVEVLDVREPFELEIAALPFTKHISVGELPARHAELDKNKEIVVYCHAGSRSTKMVRMLREKGYAKARNLAGGIDRWAQEIEPGMRRY